VEVAAGELFCPGVESAGGLRVRLRARQPVGREMETEAMKDTQNRNTPSIDIIVPLFNEELALPRFHTQLTKVVSSLSNEIRILYVDDGSSDGTPALLQKFAD
jgi:cellulose synthase/poly-beta-1,6-N-acetylglucosamine synthase-like glycosyltransferase